MGFRALRNVLAIMGAVSSLVLTAGIAMSVNGCSAFTALGDTSTPAFLVNESQGSLVVNVAMTHSNERDDGGRTLCRIDPRLNPMKIGSARDAHTRRRLGSWPSAELLEYDSSQCTATVTVGPGKALLMYVNGTCSDYERALPNPRLKPTVERLSIAGDDRRVVLEGFEVAKVFRASPANQICLYTLK
ncbi:MAG TPA: hypothetical protein VFP37_12860 [Steroidobacteraceae bacterium]|nr:hypothetical protein [Steroidobacteraceae bacterium]